MRRGDIYLVNFGKSRDTFAFGKIRPALIIQTDKLNFAVEEGLYDYFLVVPLSTQDDVLTDEFRVKIEAREGLEKDSFAVVSSICFLHKQYLLKKLTSLNDDEMQQIEQILKETFDL